MRENMLQLFQAIRKTTEMLCEPLSIEDYVIQGIEDVSPPKWHLAHTTWFFETFILQSKFTSDYRVFNPSFNYLFNSYYQGIGNPYPRSQRGLLSRPTVQQVYAYRQHVDEHILRLIENISSDKLVELNALLQLGLQHEEQHQELLLMDIKYNFFLNPDLPCYFHSKTNTSNFNSTFNSADVTTFINVAESMATIGYAGDGFCFDNELPRHQKIINAYSIAKTLVTNGEYLQFLTADGYNNPSLWLADGWEWVVSNGVKAPLYWQRCNDQWMQFTLSGNRPLNLHEPVCHVSYFEADAYARWRECRLPSEEEWEYFVAQIKSSTTRDNFLEAKLFHPQPATTDCSEIGQQFWGDLWEWTSSSYSPYPRYKPFKGLLGEYNGKFMNNQKVLRGGSCITPRNHIRASYRNFYQPDKRWPFCGIRLARDN